VIVAGALAKYCDKHVCLCVCLSVCLSVREHISGTTRANFANFSVRVAYAHDSVIFWQGDEIPRGMGNFGDCLGHPKALAIAVAVAVAFVAEGIIQSSITLCRQK